MNLSISGNEKYSSQVSRKVPFRINKVDIISKVRDSEELPTSIVSITITKNHSKELYELIAFLQELADSLQVEEKENKEIRDKERREAIVMAMT